MITFAVTLLIGAGLGFVLTACSFGSTDIATYQSNEPRFDIREYFDGKVIAFGAIKDYSGEVVSRFEAEMTGNWNGNEGTLDEVFTYDDGTTETRNWRFTFDEATQTFEGTAGDVIGAAKGEQAGNTVFMKYTLARNIDGRNLRFSVDDQLYLINDKYVINHTKLRKFGFTVAELHIAFHKL